MQWNCLGRPRTAEDVRVLRQSFRARQVANQFGVVYAHRPGVGDTYDEMFVSSQPKVSKSHKLDQMRRLGPDPK